MPNQRPWRIILNNDGDAGMNGVQVPATVDQFLEINLKPLEGSHVDALFWGLCTSNVFTHDTKVGELYGEHADSFENVGEWRLHENFRGLREGGHDPLRVVVEEGHRAGLEVFASVRMNDIHDALHTDQMCRLKKDRPDLLLGDSLNVIEPTPALYSPRTAWDYARPEVRQHRMAIIEETLRRYDVDGLEVDWSRSGWAFKPGQELQNIQLMSEFTRGVRRLMDEIGTERGRPLPMALSVPSSFRECLKIGLDVPTWLREGLIDVLIAGGPPFSPDLGEVRAATREADCRLYSRFIWNRMIFTSPEVVRAAALLHWRQGVDGLYVFNFNNRGGGLDAIKEIGDPSRLERASKRYVLDKNPDPPPDPPRHTARPAAPGAYLPLILEADADGPGQRVRFELGDDVESAAKAGALGEAMLRLKLDNFCPEQDQLDIRLNETPLPADSCKPMQREGAEWFEFRLEGPPLRQGKNTLQAALRQRNPRVRGPLVLSDVQVCLDYR